MNNKKYNYIFIAIAILALILSVFGFVSASKTIIDGARALLIICSILLILLSCIYAYVVLLSMDREPNFFLFDEQIGKNVSLDKIDYTRVSSRVDVYVSDVGGYDYVVKNYGLDNGVIPVLRPIVAFRLIQLAAFDDHAFELIDDADDKAITILCRALEMADEANMTVAISKYHQQGGNADNFRKYLANNQKYMQNKVMNYIRRNIEQFY